jgi:hypothetical protein
LGNCEGYSAEQFDVEKDAWEKLTAAIAQVLKAA